MLLTNLALKDVVFMILGSCLFCSESLGGGVSGILITAAGGDPCSAPGPRAVASTDVWQRTGVQPGWDAGDPQRVRVSSPKIQLLLF